MDIPGYLTTEQAAERLGINPQSVYNLANRAPDFPEPVKVGRASLWPIEGIDAWRAAHPARRARPESGLTPP
ncbi:helix-turn-helix transcriptional regulator [Streptomyces sp. NPDC059477]|uniref:helix-turn-helix transcriptional regulator n=1 Tax=Streptomyces sp. NPDC059477 TaxID=3346847 RepID=UPI0036B50414